MCASCLCCGIGALPHQSASHWHRYDFKPSSLLVYCHAIAFMVLSTSYNGIWVYKCICKYVKIQKIASELAEIADTMTCPLMPALLLPPRCTCNGPLFCSICIDNILRLCMIDSDAVEWLRAHFKCNLVAHFVLSGPISGNLDMMKF